MSVVIPEHQARSSTIMHGIAKLTKLSNGTHAQNCPGLGQDSLRAVSKRQNKTCLRFHWIAS